MKAKKIIGISAIAIGVIIFALGIYARSRVSEARENVKRSSGMFSNNPVNKEIGGAIERQISAYDTPVMLLMIGGVVIAGIGIATLMRSRRRR